MRKIGEHAVVLGASIGGLLAARVLAGAHDRVTIVDRDSLPPIGQNRRGVPKDGIFMHCCQAAWVSSRSCSPDCLRIS